MENTQVLTLRFACRIGEGIRTPQYAGCLSGPHRGRNHAAWWVAAIALVAAVAVVVLRAPGAAA